MPLAWVLVASCNMDDAWLGCAARMWVLMCMPIQLGLDLSSQAVALVRCNNSRLCTGIS
jgi:hypothetical protein